jgi:hypothetical protein
MGEGMVKAFAAGEGEDVETMVKVTAPAFEAAVIEEGGQLGEHDQAFLV